MTTLHLKDWRHRWSWEQRRWSMGTARETNAALLTDWLLSMCLCVSLASILPGSIAVWALAALFSVAGYVWLALAIMQAGPPAASPHLTAWDAALLSFAASFCVQTATYLGALNP
ncbi:hypothetical protein MZTS_22075 [Methylorubrum zatmanii]|nr:hypothetical protein [Methylorubrum zatmanii]